MPFIKLVQLILTLCLVASISSRPAIADNTPATSKCASIQNDKDRLNCYDKQAKKSAAQTANTGLKRLIGKQPVTTASSLSERWELDPETKQGLWVVRPYEPMYILPAIHTSNSNNAPYSPTHPAGAALPLQNTEAEFELSVKTKAAENLFGTDADFWLAYTQKSQWQLYNSKYSSPFRETDYMPEMFVLVPMNYPVFDLKTRFIRFGILHQSNGLANPLSRSWNRVYTQLGFEHNHLTLLVRSWVRIKEKLSSDDNPDITHYLGDGDVIAIYQMDNSEISTRLRYGASTLSTTTTWNFPINGRLKAYVKITTGYGETLIDYNWRQNTVGLGILLIDWQ